MNAATFVLMNCDLVAVPLRLARGGVVTVYCGARRASDLLSRRRLSDQTPGALAQTAKPVRRSALHEAALVDRR